MRLLAICTVLGPAGCREDSAPHRTASPPAARYQLQGKIVSIDKPRKTLTVDHADIPGFIGCDDDGVSRQHEGALDALAAGDQITANVVTGNGASWLEELAVTNETNGGATPVARAHTQRRSLVSAGVTVR